MLLGASRADMIRFNDLGEIYIYINEYNKIIVVVG